MIRIAPTPHRLLVRAVWLVPVLLVGAVPCVAQDSPVIPPPLAVDSGELRRGSPKLEEREGGDLKPVATDHQMLHKYVWSTLGLEGAIHATLANGLSPGKENPPEGGLGAGG